MALALALDHPGRIGGLALIAPLTQPQESVPAAFRGIAIASPAVRRAVAWTLATPVGLLSGRKGAVAVFAPEPVPADFATLGGGQLVLRPGAFHAASTDLAAARADMAALAARYGDLAIPVAILFGRDDHILDPAIHGARIAADVPRGGTDPNRRRAHDPGDRGGRGSRCGFGGGSASSDAAPVMEDSLISPA